MLKTNCATCEYEIIIEDENDYEYEFHRTGKPIYYCKRCYENLMDSLGDQ